MDWFRKLSPRGKRVAIIAGATALGVALVMLSRRGGGGASSASTETLDATGVPMAAGVLPGAYLPNADYSSSTSSELADIRESIADVGRRIDDVGAMIPSPTAASDVAQAVGEVLRPIVDSALAATVTTPPPITASPAPTAPAAPQPAPKPGLAKGTIVWQGKAKPNMATLRAAHPGVKLDDRPRGGGQGWVVVVI